MESHTNYKIEGKIMKKMYAMAACCFLLVSCSQDRDSGDIAETDVNEGQRGAYATSPASSNVDTDRQITQLIRQAIQNRRDLSQNAKGVTVTTINGVVQLKGKVDNEMERTLIVQITRRVPGVQNVDVKLDIPKK